jgi:recombination protein RecA
VAKEKGPKRVSPTVAADKVAAATEVRLRLNKKYGAGTMVRMGEKVGIKHPCIPSGIYQLDHDVIVAGGVPEGRVTEIYGPESSGKTTITLQIIAQAQARGGQCAFVDAEHALDVNWATVLGVDVDALDINQPDNGEQALDILEELVRSGAYAVIAVDSVAALVPRAELDGEMGDSNVGLQARMMSQALRRLTGAVSKTHTAVIFINQLRDKIGVMYGSPEVTTGGKALRFYASVRLDVRRVEVIKDGELAIGNKVKFKAVKNKVGPPFRECHAELMYGSGFNVIGSVLDGAISSGVVQQSGAWYSWAGERFQGKASFVAHLKENPEQYEQLYNALREADTREAVV